MKNVQLRNSRKENLATIVAMENNRENIRFISPNIEEEHLSLLNDENVSHLLLMVDDRAVGFAILLGKKDPKRIIEFRRIVISKKGKGYGRSAIKKIVQHCFEELNAHRLWLDVLESNERARHLYISEGFKEGRRINDYQMADGRTENLLILSILASHYRNSRL